LENIEARAAADMTKAWDAHDSADLGAFDQQIGEINAGARQIVAIPSSETGAERAYREAVEARHADAAARTVDRRRPSRE
jgi:hypothetical protein